VTSSRYRKEALLIANLAEAAAEVAGDGRGPGRSAGSLAGLTEVEDGQIDLRAIACGRLFESYLEVIAKIGTPLWPVSPRGSRAEQITEEVAKNVVQASEIGWIPPASRGRRRNARVSILVVSFACVCV
jgi:hypothetical protein